MPTNKKSIQVNCGNCKFIMQGKHSCYCANPNKESADYKNYTYHSFGIDCRVFEERMPQESMEVIAKNLGLKKYKEAVLLTTGKSHSYEYYK